MHFVLHNSEKDQRTDWGSISFFASKIELSRENSADLLGKDWIGEFEICTHVRCHGLNDVLSLDMFAEFSLVKASVAKQYTNDFLNWAELATGYILIAIFANFAFASFKVYLS